MICGLKKVVLITFVLISLFVDLLAQGEPQRGGQRGERPPKGKKVFDQKQTISQGAQVHTIAFSAVAFYSGCYYASSFYPPGKVADYFGFQYMRDNDLSESGHNTDFLTKAAWHTMRILNETQMQLLIDLAVEQEKLFNDYALGRLTLIKAFHRCLDGDFPTGKNSLNWDEVKKVSEKLYLIDGEISYGRAMVFAKVIHSLTPEQVVALQKLGKEGMQSWTMPERPKVQIPRGLNVWVMSNASELFSWYLRNVEADIYFCPERQGTYFGGFYMKDAPAVGTPGYAIDPQATANKGAILLNDLLTTSQADEIRAIYPKVVQPLNNIVAVRTKISNELRKAIAGQTPDKTLILQWSKEYGNYDAEYIYAMVGQFVKVGKTLTDEQKEQLHQLRGLDNYPCKEGKVFLYSREIDEPLIPNTDHLFK